MTDVDLHDQDDATCPKRNWVMSMLSDDEALGQDGALPRGLQFHLSRCDSCRALADRLTSVSGALRSLSEIEPPVELTALATAQATQALSDGARFTGRVSIPDGPPTAPSTGAHGYRFARYAAAAAVLLVVGVYGLLAPDRNEKGLLVVTTTPGEAHLPDVPAPEGSPGGLPPDVTAPEVPDTAVASAEPDSSSPNELAERAVDGGGVGPPAVSGRKPRRICRYYSHVDAAMCDDPDCVSRAVILPRHDRRDLGWARTLFDNRPATVSTRTRPRGE
jgi:hypothetical protein